jgi:acetate kinase
MRAHRASSSACSTRAPRDPVLLSKGTLEDAGSQPHFAAKNAAGHTLVERDWPSGSSHELLLRGLLDWTDEHLGAETLTSVGHRIVHGGRAFDRPVRLTPELMAALADLTPLAPLHQPRSLAAIHVIAAIRPDLPQVGCFDTAFHHALAPPVSRFALPRVYEAEGVRRYGFHGLSYEYIASRLQEISPAFPARRTVVAHLGNGASLCAMRDGRSVDTTMGFTALDVLVMGTRCGAIDPGVLLYLQQARGMAVRDVEQLLYRKSGLLGVSDVSSDVRTLLASDNPDAAEALELFAFQIARQTAAMANTLAGCRCNTAGTSAAHDADAARRTRSHGRGTRVGSSRSVVQRNRSATAIVALSVCRECPSRECAA